MLLRNDAERTLDFVDLDDGEPEFFASVAVRVERANGDLLPFSIVLDGNLN